MDPNTGSHPHPRLAIAGSGAIACGLAATAAHHGPVLLLARSEEAADRARPLVDAHPEYPILAYNLACVESLAGRKEDAIEHLRQAAEKSDRAREFAVRDSDFDAIRDEPAFKELIGQ